jgi:cytochrome c-type biogenesis protein CcmH/NrfF
MQRLRSSFLVLGLAAFSLAQTSSQLLTPEIKRVGFRLACLCGACKNTVGDCAMLECHYSKPARVKIATLQAGGTSDDAIVDSFVQERGLQALSSPPTTGFSFLAWIMPFVALGLGLGAIFLFIQRVHPRRATANAPEVDADLMRRYQATIEKESAKLD